MATESIAMTKITHELVQLHQQRATGELLITTRDELFPGWRLYFYLGRLVYATGGFHPVRRWYRAFQQHSPDALTADWLATAKSDQELWEVDLLNQAVSQGLINTTQAKAIVQAIVQEVMFAVVGQKVWKSQWYPGKQIAQRTAFLSIEQVIHAAQKLRKEWRSSGLGSLQELLPQFSPDLAPVLRNRPQLESKLSPTTYKSLLRMMKGQLTLWDIALEMQRPLPDIIRALLPLMRRGVIELKEIPDRAAPITTAAATSPLTRGLIACIDDNASIGEAIEQIVQPLGYEVLMIANPLQGLPQLIESKPALIFLDLVLPNTNGYELCTFLRKTSAFQNTPIVILTGQDGVIDRVRAKLAGSSDFLTKPPESAKIVQILEKYLGAIESGRSEHPSRWATV